MAAESFEYVDRKFYLLLRAHHRRIRHRAARRRDIPLDLFNALSRAEATVKIYIIVNRHIPVTTYFRFEMFFFFFLILPRSRTVHTVQQCSRQTPTWSTDVRLFD